MEEFNNCCFVLISVKKNTLKQLSNAGLIIKKHVWHLPILHITGPQEGLKWGTSSTAVGIISPRPPMKQGSLICQNRWGGGGVIDPLLFRFRQSCKSCLRQSCKLVFAIQVRIRTGKYYLTVNTLLLPSLALKCFSFNSILHLV